MCVGEGKGGCYFLSHPKGHCIRIKAVLHLNVVFKPLNMGLIEISRSRFKQYKNSSLISQFYVRGNLYKYFFKLLLGCSMGVWTKPE